MNGNLCICIFLFLSSYLFVFMSLYWYIYFSYVCIRMLTLVNHVCEYMDSRYFKVFFFRRLLHIPPYTMYIIVRPSTVNYHFKLIHGYRFNPIVDEFQLFKSSNRPLLKHAYSLIHTVCSAYRYNIWSLSDGS